MQTTLENKGWFIASRCKGIFRYHQIRMLKIVFWVLAGLLIAELAALAMSLAVGGHYQGMGVAANYSTTMILTLVCASIMANKGTRFLLRFGTTRLSVWLVNIVSLTLWMVVFLLGTFVLSMISGGAVLLLSNVYPSSFELISYFMPELNSAQVFSTTLTKALSTLPTQILWTAEWCSLLYLLGCCMRRKKWLTLAVILGVPLIAMISMFVPIVQQTIAAVQSADQGTMMVMGLQGMQWLSKMLLWVETQWQWIQLGAAVVSLPLSYWCMRTTKQP